MKYDKAPCPFCGSHNVVVKHWGREGKMFVNCRDCLACGPADYYTEDAVAAWNKSKAVCDAIGEPARGTGIQRPTTAACAGLCS